MPNGSMWLCASLTVLCFTLGGACNAAAPAAADPGSTESLLKQAIRLTAQRKMAEAERLYRDLAAKDPCVGYPALSRFLARTGQTTVSAGLLNEPAVGKLSPFVRARIALALDQTSAALDLLKMPAVPGERYEQTMLLANTLQGLGQKTDALTVLKNAVVDATLAPNSRLDLFKKMVRSGEGDMLTDVVLTAMESFVTSSSVSFPDLRAIANDCLNIISTTGKYTDLHDELGATADKSATRAWLFTISCLKRGDVPAALKAMEPYATKDISPREKVIINEEYTRINPSDLTRNLRMIEEIIPYAPDPDRLRVVAGQMAFRQKNYEKVIALIGAANPNNLDEGEQRQYANLRLAGLAARGTPEEILAVFEDQATSMTWEQKRELAQAPFVTMLDLGSYNLLQEAVTERLKETTAPADLYVLVMSLKNAMGDTNGALEALEAYVRKTPGDTQALQELTSVKAAGATSMLQDQSTATAEQLKQTADEAAKTLWEMVRTRPYEPTNYRQLVDLYQASGDVEKAKRVPEYLVKSTSPTAEQLHFAAYLYLSCGFPEEALPPIEQSLKMEPDSARHQMTYAMVLSRLGRGAEADQIYRRLIHDGSHKRAYNVDDLYLSAVNQAQSDGKMKEFLEWAQSLVKDKTVVEHPQYLLNMGRLLVNKGYTDEGLVFLDEVVKTYPQHVEEARDAIMHTYMVRREFTKAEEVIQERYKVTTTTADLVEKVYNLAELKRAKGETTAAIEMWTELSNRYPAENLALRGLILAARLSAEQGDVVTARQFLRRVLTLDTGNSDAEVAARDMLRELGPMSDGERSEVVRDIQQHTADRTHDHSQETTPSAP